MQNKSILKLAALCAAVVLLLIIIGGVVSISNQEVGLRNQFNQKISERTAFYDQMWKTFSQKSQIAVKNDSSFRRVVDIQMTGQKSGENVMWQWIQQSNPTATFGEVSRLYQDLSRTIESKRSEFFEQEKMLQDVKLQHDNLIGKFPASMYLSILDRKELIYKPITSDRTDAVIKSGKDNDTELGL